MRNILSSKVTLAAMLLLISVLACSPLGGTLGSKTEATQVVPPREVPVSTQEAEAGEAILKEAQKGDTIRLTESQFTSLLNANLPPATENEVNIKDLTVWFDPDVVSLRARVSGGDLPNGQLFVSGKLRVEDQKLAFQLEKASINDINLPSPLLKMFTDKSDVMFQSAFQDVHFKSVAVEKGAIVLQFAQ